MYTNQHSTRMKRNPEQQANSEDNLEDSKNRFRELIKKFDPGHKILQTEDNEKEFDSGSSVDRSPSDISYVSMISSDSNKSDYCVLRDTFEQQEKAYFRREKFSSVFGNVPLYMPTHSDTEYSSEPIYMEVGTAAADGDSPSSSPTSPPKLPKRNIFRNISRRKSAPKESLSTFYVDPNEFNTTPRDLCSHETTESHYAIVVIPEDGHGRLLSEQLAGKGPGRTTWKSMAQVKLDKKCLKLPDIEIQIQEAQFEVITSEASYYRSLTVFIDVFYSAKEFDCSKSTSGSLLTLTDKHHLFSNILSVHLASEKFLNDLENLWLHKGPVIDDICETVRRNLDNNSLPYVVYLTNINYQREALDKLIKNEAFRTTLISLEQNPKCNRLPMDSFLMLPMHRLTKLRLLLITLLKLLNKSNRNRIAIHNCQLAINSIESLLKKGETSRQELEDKTRLIHLCCCIDYQNCKPISMNCTKLIMEGELKAVCSPESGQIIKNHLGSKMKKMYLILLSHVLILTTQSKGKYMVIDYAMKPSFSSSLFLASVSSPIQTDHAFTLQLMDTYLQPGYSEVILITTSKNDRNTWYNALNPNVIDRSHPDRSVSCSDEDDYSINTNKEDYVSQLSLQTIRDGSVCDYPVLDINTDKNLS